MKTIKIALFDLRHGTRGTHAKQMPLSIGFLAMYAQQEVTNAKLEFRLYISADDFLAEFRDWKPDIVGGTLYNWNRRLSLLCMAKVRDHLPDTFTVFGGPEIDKENNKIKEFLVENPFIDSVVLGEGEKPFVEMVKHVVDGADIRCVETLRGAYYLKQDGETLVTNEPAEKFVSLDEIPSPYLAGLFDRFFEMGMQPMLQTARGCPFGCTFCVMSLKMHNKVRFVSTDRFQADMDYCATRLQGRHDIPLRLCDSNFGMFKQTIPIVEIIRGHQDKSNWPRYVTASTGKNQKERVIHATRILKWGMPATMSAQSMNPETLEAIDRSNISLVDMQEMVEKQNTGPSTDSYSELIFNLPMETLDTFEQGLRKVVDTRINRIIIMTLSLLRGTPMADEESHEKYGFEIKKRIIPRAFGTYEGMRIFETEDAVVATNTMPFENYLYLRRLQFVINILYNSDFFNLTKRYLRESKIDVYDWLKTALDHVKSGTGKAREHFDLFAEESADELFDDDEALAAFIAKDENYEGLMSGQRGDNLMNKYLLLSLSEGFTGWLDAATDVGYAIARKSDSNNETTKQVFDNIRKYQAMMYDIAPHFDHLPKANVKQRTTFDFDIQRWANDPELELSDCKGKTQYDIWYSEKKVMLMKQCLSSGHDQSQTRQFIYRDVKYHAFIPEIDKISDQADQVSQSGKTEPRRHLGTEHRLFR